MKIIDLKKFRTLPEGVVFLKYKPQFFEELCVKGETWDYDFLSAGLTANILCNGSEDYERILSNAENNSNLSLKLGFDGGRDGFFEESQLFAVYEQSDIDQLIEELKKCKGVEA